MATMLREVVEANFHELFSKPGAKIIQDDHTPGRQILILKSGNVLFRFFEVRGIGVSLLFDLDLAPVHKPDEHEVIDWAIWALRGITDVPTMRPGYSFSQKARLLLDHYATFQEAFSPEKYEFTRQAFTHSHALAKARRQELTKAGKSPYLSFDPLNIMAPKLVDTGRMRRFGFNSADLESLAQSLEAAMNVRFACRESGFRGGVYYQAEVPGLEVVLQKNFDIQSFGPFEAAWPGEGAILYVAVPADETAKDFVAVLRDVVRNLGAVDIGKLNPE